MKERLLLVFKWSTRIYPFAFILWWVIFTLNNGYYPDSTIPLWLFLAGLWPILILIRWVLTGELDSWIEKLLNKVSYLFKKK